MIHTTRGLTHRQNGGDPKNIDLSTLSKGMKKKEKLKNKSLGYGKIVAT
jgi:hypothetical protein